MLKSTDLRKKFFTFLFFFSPFIWIFYKNISFLRNERESKNTFFFLRKVKTQHLSVILNDPTINYTNQQKLLVPYSHFNQHYIPITQHCKQPDREKANQPSEEAHWIVNLVELLLTLLLLLTALLLLISALRTNLTVPGHRLLLLHVLGLLQIIRQQQPSHLIALQEVAGKRRRLRQPNEEHVRGQQPNPLSLTHQRAQNKRQVKVHATQWVLQLCLGSLHPHQIGH